MRAFLDKIPRGYPIKMLREMRRKPWVFLMFFIANLGNFLGKIGRGQTSKMLQKPGGDIGIFYVVH